jgi:hypothetical protein
MTAALQLFPASQIALALGRKRQAIARVLESVPPSGEQIIAGNLAKVWAFPALPSRLQSDLNECATRRGFRGAEAMLTSELHPFAEEFEKKLRACPINQLRAEFVSRALKLRDALAAPLAQQHTLNNRDLTELGLREFNRAFGYGISAKHWNRVFDRTVLRDNGAEQFHRAELYLDDAAFCKPIAKVALVAKQFNHEPLKELLGDLLGKESLSSDDREQLWCSAFAHFETLCASHARREHVHAKASLVAFLHSAFPRLSKSAAGLRRTFELRAKRDSQRDRRSITSGNFRAPLCDGCKQTLISLAVAHDGNESLAYRLARKNGLLCESCTSGHSFNLRVNKSAVPEVVREQITPLVDSVLPLHRGPREAQMRGPYIIRDWSGVTPGDWFVFDDVSWNSHFRVFEYAYRVEEVVMRGECLLGTDARCAYPLDFSLIPGKYNGEHIRGLTLKIHDNVGLPHEGVVFENGVWRSRLVVGDRKALHWREFQLGLESPEIGIRVHHAQPCNPRSKTIEGTWKILQERMRSLPNFVGFDERRDRRERVQELLSRARRGDDGALAKLPTMEEWMRTIRAVLDEFAHDPQNGKMLNGATPAEMWNDAIARRPLRRLPAEARFILATHRQPVRVRQEGILLTVRGQKFLYANDQTGALIGRDVLAHYNVECPELLTVSDMKRQNFFTVKRIELPAMSATDEQFAEVHAQIRGHRAAAKALYGEIKHDLVATITRDNEHDQATKELGRFHNEQVQAHTQQKAERTRKLRKVQTAAAVAGAAVNPNVRNPDRVLQGIELEQQMRARLAAKEQQT